MSELGKIFGGAVVLAAIGSVVMTLAHRSNQKQVVYAPSVAVLEIEGTKTGAVLDPNVQLQPNDWMKVDLDGDGREDKVMLREGDLLFWSRGLEDGFKEAVPVCKLKFHPYAYAVGLIDGQRTLQFWDNDRREYRQTCLGVDTTGKPFFGEVEQR